MPSAYKQVTKPKLENWLPFPLRMNSEVEQAASHLLAGKYFQLAAFVMLVYDHLLTFGQEVERVWKQRLSAASVLFLVNRYATILQFVALLDAFHNPHWAGQVCNRSVLFEGSSTVALVAVGQLIMILRVFALYERSMRVLVFLMTLWLLQIVISAVGLQTGFPVPLPTGLAGCILTGTSPLFPSLWIAPLFTDSAVFFLTLYRTKRYLSNNRNLSSPYASFPFRLKIPILPSTRSYRATGLSLNAPVETIRLMSEVASRTITILVRDGALYFLLIFLANLMNALIYFLAAPDLKAIGASFSQLITCTMISRLVLNLRSVSTSSFDQTFGEDAERHLPYRDTGAASFSLHSPATDGLQYGNYRNKPRASLWTRALGNLGGRVSFGITSRSMTGTRGMGVEVVTTTEVRCDIPMESINESHI
ncbi:hypothetical protein P691DRAFT_735258 [Macrolepiota fuliginosa MF-IS2]|uniref:DUF6533 domain-containing protein n=1 Tax=Macrolepiota fuliginosa MF-IS2 TaxID=1400762 RepID=A0A9P6BZD1_9AGAR|nr:hypothetical protein P691DRAFT_735258 [Macrolepiota fuliginosa MF-IS2]